MAEADSTPRPPVLEGLDHGKLDLLPPDIAAGLQERLDILYEFASNPGNPETWDFVADKAHAEEDESVAQPEELSRIPVDSLVDLAQAVLHAKPEDRYAQVAAKAPNGEVWFDVLYGFQSPDGDRAVAAFLQDRASHQKIEKIVDLGTGTGNTAAATRPYTETTVGIDRNPALLKVAAEKHPEIEFAERSVTELPFEDESVDVVTSDGLKYSLDKATSVAMYSEIARVLKDGGVYIDSDWEDAADIGVDVHPGALKSFVTWRAVLQDMIVDSVSGKLEKTDALDMSEGQEWEDLKTSLGLKEQFVHFDPEVTKAYARLLIKTPRSKEPVLAIDG